MPTKPKHPCAHPGCPEQVESGQRYCEKHRRQEAKRYERYGRDPETRGRYNYQWKKIRYEYLRAHPLCERCKAEGRATEANVVHHITPLAAGGTHASENLMALCKQCHSRIHAENGDRWGK